MDLSLYAQVVWHTKHIRGTTQKQKSTRISGTLYGLLDELNFVLNIKLLSPSLDMIMYLDSDREDLYNRLCKHHLSIFVSWTIEFSNFILQVLEIRGLTALEVNSTPSTGSGIRIYYMGPRRSDRSVSSDETIHLIRLVVDPRHIWRIDLPREWDAIVDQTVLYVLLLP